MSKSSTKNINPVLLFSGERRNLLPMTRPRATHVRFKIDIRNSPKKQDFSRKACLLQVALSSKNKKKLIKTYRLWKLLTSSMILSSSQTIFRKTEGKSF